MQERCEEAETSLRLLARDDKEKELLEILARRDGAAVAAARSDLVLNDEFYMRSSWQQQQLLLTVYIEKIRILEIR
jgi:hypothetical protein